MSNAIRNTASTQPDEITYETEPKKQNPPSPEQHDTTEPFKASRLLSPIDVTLAVIFGATALLAILPGSTILGSQAQIGQLLQEAAQAALTSVRTVDPQGRAALFLMALFCGWFVGAMVLWPKNELVTPLTTVQQQVLDLCQNLANAAVKNDTTALNSILHDEFVFTDEHGKKMGKAEFLVVTRPSQAKSQVLSAEMPCITGSRAFVEGTAEIVPQSAHDESIIYRFSTRLARVNGRWKAVEQKMDHPVRRRLAHPDSQLAAA